MLLIINNHIIYVIVCIFNNIEGRMTSVLELSPRGPEAHAFINLIKYGTPATPMTRKTFFKFSGNYAKILKKSRAWIITICFRISRKPRRNASSVLYAE